MPLRCPRCRFWCGRCRSGVRRHSSRGGRPPRGGWISVQVLLLLNRAVGAGQHPIITRRDGGTTAGRAPAREAIDSALRLGSLHLRHPMAAAFNHYRPDQAAPPALISGTARGRTGPRTAYWLQNAAAPLSWHPFAGRPGRRGKAPAMSAVRPLPSFPGIGVVPRQRTFRMVMRQRQDLRARRTIWSYPPRHETDKRPSSMQGLDNGKLGTTVRCPSDARIQEANKPIVRHAM